MAAFAALMVVAAFVYALHYFDAVKGLFHALMLLFMMGLTGYSLTGDIFDLLVFFELMSVVAYALTAYRIEERAPIQGAINFAITNSVGGYAMFIGVGLLYARTGTLTMASIGTALNGHHADALVIVAHGAAVPRPSHQGGGRAAALLAGRCACGGADPGLRAVQRRDGGARALRHRPPVLGGLRRRRWARTLTRCGRS